MAITNKEWDNYVSQLDESRKAVKRHHEICCNRDKINSTLQKKYNILDAIIETNEKGKEHKIT